MAERRWGGGRVWSGVLAVLVVALGLRTWMRNLDWQDDLSLGRAVVAASPDSFKAHKMLAYALHEADPAHGHLDEAIAEAERGLQCLQGLPDSRNNTDSHQRTAGYYAERGEAMERQGKAGAVGDFRRARDLLVRARAIGESQVNGEKDVERFADLGMRIGELNRRLGNGGSAMEEALAARELDPGNTAVHRQIASLLLDANRPDQAAAALMEGVLVTSDVGLRNELLRLYRDGLDRAGCATMMIQGNTALNQECPLVHQHLCAASKGTIELRKATHREDLAETMRRTALEQFHCKPDELK
jgi:hypothetical protein